MVSRPCILTDLLSWITQCSARSHFSLRACGLADSIACNNVIKQRILYLVVKEKNLSALPEAGEMALCDLVMGQGRVT